MNDERVISSEVSRAFQVSERDSYRNFFKLWVANSSSNMGDGLYQFALPLVALQLTTSPGLVAGVNVMLTLAWPLFALQAGSIVDRTDRRKLMLGVNLARILAMLALTVSLLTGSASITLLYGVALLLGIGETLVDTSLTSMVPAVVPRQRLNWANSRIEAAQTVTNAFIGPPLAGYLAGLGLALATGVSALMYVAASMALTVMHGSFRPAPSSRAGPGGDFWRHLTEGLRFLWRHPLLRTLTLFTAAMNIFWAGWAAVLVLYMVSPGPVGLSKFEYGLLLTALAVGGISGSMLCGWLERRWGARSVMSLDIIGTALMLGVPALTTNPLAIGAATLMGGLGSAVWRILSASIRQSLIPDELLGRVYSASRLISWGVGPLGAALAGLLAELWGVRSVFAIGGVVNLALLVLFLRVVRPQVLANVEAARQAA